MKTPENKTIKAAGSLNANKLFTPKTSPDIAVSQVGKGGF